MGTTTAAVDDCSHGYCVIGESYNGGCPNCKSHGTGGNMIMSGTCLALMLAVDGSTVDNTQGGNGERMRVGLLYTCRRQK